MKSAMAAVAGESVPSCTAQDYTFEVFNVVPNGVCTSITDTLNVGFSVLITGNPARYDLSIGYTKSNDPILIDVRCLTTGYDVNGGGCNDYDKNASPVTATSDLNVSCDVDGNLLVDPFLNVDFYLNWDIDKNNPHTAEITSPKCRQKTGSSLPLKPAKLTLVKNVINDNIGTSIATDWILSANIGGAAAELSGTSGVTSSDLAGGEYVLSESAVPSGYSLTSISCPGGTYDTATQTLSLAPEEDITCTFTNDDDIPPYAAIKLAKTLSAESGLTNGFVESGELLTYTITLSNVGSVDGTITIDEKVPAGSTFVATGNDFITAICVNGAAASTTCSLTSPNVPALGTTTMTFVVQANNPLTTSSIENYVIENGDAPPTCTTTENNDSRCVSTAIVLPIVSLQKISITVSDPINGTTNPKAIPSAISEYTITVINTGLGVADNNSIVLIDAIPNNTAFYVDDISGVGTGPVQFVDGSPSSGLNFNFTSLGSATDNVSFSNNGGVDYSYTPSADGDGVDTAVTHIKMATQGAFLGNNGSGAPNFQFKFRVRVQ